MIRRAVAAASLLAMGADAIFIRAPHIGDHRHHEHVEARADMSGRAVDTTTIPRPQFGSVPWGVDIRSCTQPGMMALTFDDGPESFTTDLLDTLAAAGAKATFLMVGTMMTKYPEIVQRAHAEGHHLGSHSWSHQDLEVYSGREAEVLQNEAAFLDILGFFPTYFRPPYTSCGAQCMDLLTKWGYHVINYDVDTKDFEGDYNFAQNTFLAGINAGGSKIVLNHDIQDKTVHGFAQFMIEKAQAAGYKLVTVGECLGDPSGNWYRDASGNPVGGGAVTSASSSAVSSTAPPTTSSALPTTTSSSSVPATTSSAAPETTSAAPTTSVSSSATADGVSTTTSAAPTSTPNAAAGLRAAGSMVGAVAGLLAYVLA